MFTRSLNNVPVVLKDPCDLLAPTFTYQGEFPETANYFAVWEWNKFFWITSIVFVKGHWEFSGKIDVLATYREAIEESQQFVARAQTEWDRTIADALCQPTGVMSSYTTPYSMGFSNTGTYIIGVASANGPMYYACDKANFNALYTSVFSNGFLESLLQQFANAVSNVTIGPGQTFLNSFYNSFIDPGQYIQSAVWIPFPVDGDPETIYLGITPTSAVGIPVSANRIVARTSIQLDLAGAWGHPQRMELGTWVNTNIGRKISISIPAIGDINLDLGSNPDTCIIEISCDIFGGIVCRIITPAQTIVRNGNVGAQVGIANIRSDVQGALASLGSAAAGIATGNPIMTAHGLISGAANLVDRVDTISTGTSMAVVSAAQTLQVMAQYVMYKNASIIKMGKPLCQYRLISGLQGGYIECINATKLNSAATEAEKLEIQKYMNEGFYYE